MQSMYDAHDTKLWLREGLKPLRNMAEQVQEMVGASTPPRVGTNIRAAILILLSEQPMHGYQLIREIFSRSEGLWQPSPSVVYPQLAMMVDEGLAVVERTDGKKFYQLTEEGEEAARPLASAPAPWAPADDEAGGRQSYQRAATQLAQAVIQLKASASHQQVDAATEVLRDARRRLYAILAED
ncbi:PadR family transcriptional regulator [Ornithinimicrobium sp. Arc0846-15]|nr:PadR family transcriptional regulator [Ornithinimicrobium laminariae]